MNVGENPNPSKIACVRRRARRWAFVTGIGVWTANIAFLFGVLRNFGGSQHNFRLGIYSRYRALGHLKKYAYGFGRGVRLRPMKTRKAGIRSTAQCGARRYNCLIGQSNGGCENYAFPNGCWTAIWSIIKLRGVSYPPL
ncbi:hypothetical protein BC629DRAFT_1445172 [Irpex lacteus]|nr:hypothetical protein BC629DRAFT_1445172 [Irpex lacteus]